MYVYQGLELLQRQQLTELRQQRDVCLMITTRLSEPTVLAQLQANLHQMFLKSDSVFNCDAGGSIDAQGTGSGSAASMHVNETHDPVAGMSVETRSNTRVRCSFQEAGQVMWQGAAPLQAPTTEPCSVVVRKDMPGLLYTVGYVELTLDVVSCSVNQPFLRDARSRTPASRRASTSSSTGMSITPWGSAARRTRTSLTRTSASCSCGRPRSCSRATAQQRSSRKAGSWPLRCRPQRLMAAHRCRSSRRATRHPVRRHLATRRLGERWRLS